MNKLKTIDREAISWKFFFKIQKFNPLKQFGKHYLDRGSIRSRKWNRLSTWQNSTQNPSQIGAHFVTIYIHKFPFKNVIFLAIGCKMYLKIAALVAFKTDHALRREENKVEFLEGRFLDEKLPFLHKKKAEHSFALFLSIFCLLTVYF